jgi:hypothetical protein
LRCRTPLPYQKVILLEKTRKFLGFWKKTQPFIIFLDKTQQLIKIFRAKRISLSKTLEQNAAA